MASLRQTFVDTGSGYNTTNIITIKNKYLLPSLS